jgi:hypothetical protein
MATICWRSGSISAETLCLAHPHMDGVTTRSGQIGAGYQGPTSLRDQAPSNSRHAMMQQSGVHPLQPTGPVVDQILIQTNQAGPPARRPAVSTTRERAIHQ